MIVKIQHFKENVVGVWEEQIYSDVEKVYRFRDVIDNEFLHLKINNQELLELIPITKRDEEGNHPSLVGAVWLMNNEGKTIERLV